MGISYFAPQAYTKETLAEAFEWLKKQPSHVKQFTKSADELVSLYLNSKKQGGKVSESFIKDLAGLAKDLEAFEEEQITQPPIATPKVAQKTGPTATSYAQPTVTTTAPAAPIKVTSSQLPAQTGLNLDIRSQEFINQTKHRFNLKSDDEALRMLIVLGYEKIQSI